MIDEIVPLEFTLEKVLGLGMCLPGPGTIFRADAAREIQGRSTQLKFASDYDFWLRLSQVGKITHRNELVAQWRQHDGSTSVASRGKAMGDERINLIDNYIANYTISETLAQTAVASSRYFAAALGIFDRNVESRKLMLESIRISKGIPKVAKAHVVLFALLHPFSYHMLKLASKFSQKINERIKNI